MDETCLCRFPDYKHSLLDDLAIIYLNRSSLNPVDQHLNGSFCYFLDRLCNDGYSRIENPEDVMVVKTNNGNVARNGKI